MERELWPLLYRALMEVATDVRQRYVQMQPWVLVAVALWAALHDRPICWACQPRHWSTTTLRPARLPSPSTLSRRLDSIGVGLLWRVLEARLRGRGGVRLHNQAVRSDVPAVNESQRFRRTYAGAFDAAGKGADGDRIRFDQLEERFIIRIPPAALLNAGNGVTDGSHDSFINRLGKLRPVFDIGPDCLLRRHVFQRRSRLDEGDECRDGHRGALAGHLVSGAR